jgi:uncharacterized protein (DUF885 family)
MKTLSSLWVKSLLLLLLGSCASPPKLTPSELRAERLNALLEDYFEAYLKLDPLFASSIGDHRYDADLEIPFLEDHRKKEEALMESALSAVREVGCRDLPPSALYTCMTFVAEQENNLSLLRADLDRYMPFNQFDSFFSNFAELAAGTSYVRFEKAEDYRNFMSRIRKAAARMDATRDALREGGARGIVIPRALAEKAIKQLHDLLPEDPVQSVFFKPLNAFPRGVSLRERSEIRPEYEALVKNILYPSYQGLLDYVRRDYLPKTRTSSGISELPGGREFYRALVKYHTMTELTPDRIMTLGLSEVARIRKQMEEVKHSLGFQGKLTDFFQSLRKDPKLYPFHSPQEVMTAYSRIQDTLNRHIPDHFRLLPKARFEIREVEKFKAESASEAYQNPSADGSRPGIFWVPIPDPRKYESKSMESLFLHEAIPGHHFQISIQQELDLPRYRKFSGNNAYVEGWGLYAESLGRDLGLYTDPYQWVGRLQYEMHRAIRLVVDVGIHWKGWSRERAIRFSLENEPLDEAGIIAEIERYMAIPGQALSYKIGELKLQELKDYAKKELGNAYTDPEFHDEILKDGALPLSVLDRKIRDWVARKKPSRGHS